MKPWLVLAALVVLWLIVRARRPADDRAKARKLLGIGVDADAAAIRAAHRRLVADVHPDRGGSAELTRRANVARDLLLRGR